VSRDWRFRLEAALAAGVSALVRPLPRGAARAIGRGLGRVWARLDSRHLAIAADNLRRAFPAWSHEQVERTARAVYVHFAQVMLELLWMPGRSREQVMSFVDGFGVEAAARAETSGRGYIFVCAHFGNWEIHGISHAWRTGRPFGVIARPLDNPALDTRLCAVRTMSGHSVIYKRRALQQVLKLLREGKGVAILIDQNVQEDDGIFVDFFGRKAATTTVAAALAVKTGAWLIPSYAELQPDGRYHAVCEPPLEWTPSGDRDRDVAGLTQQLTTVIEGWIRRRPEQWLWMHRRWKTQPRENE
jgi:Kdo2-lipid IVA lauroyltransferase/acyltransferase